MKPNKFDKVLMENLDKTLAISGVIIALIMVLILIFFLPETAYRYIEAPIMIFLACIVYLLIRNRIHKTAGLSYLEELHANRSTILILNILFVFLFSYSIFSVATRPELYSRPLGYFVATSLLVAILAVEILFLPNKKGYTLFILLKIMLVALSLRWTPQLIFPGLLGIDPWWHQMFTMKILELGHIPYGYSYSKLPIMHLIIGSTSLVTGLGYKLSTMLSICLLQVIGLIFIFVVGKFVYNEKVGLLASLLLGVGAVQIQLGLWTRPILLGTILLPVIVYMLFKSRANENKSIIFVSLAILTSAILILTHTIASLSMVMLLFSFWFGFEIYKRIYHDRYITPISFSFSLLFMVAMFGWWIYASGHITQLAHLIEWGFKVDKWGYSDVATPSIDKFKVEHILNTFAFNLFGAFFMFGSLHLFNRNKYAFAIVLGGYLLAIMIFFTMILGLTGILQMRWYPSFQTIASFPAAVGIFMLHKLSKNNVNRVFLPIILIFLFSFFAITTPIANVDHSVYSKNTLIRYAYTESEIQGANTISQTYTGKIGIDSYYIVYFLYLPKSSLSIGDITDNLYLGEYETIEGLVVIRKEVREKPFRRRIGIFKIDYDPQEKLDNLNFNRIYDSNSVTAFLK